MQSQVAEVKNKVDIVALIGGYVNLKKAGRNYKGLCPFHNEKTPSFMVSGERQIFKCFGCNEGGDSLAFYQKIEGLEFPEALKALAEKVGVQLREVKFKPGENQREVFTRINSLVSEFYNYLLTKHSSGKKALEYLKARGLTQKTIEDWQIGFAPDSWDTTFKFLIKKKFDIKEITSSGIALPSTGRGAYDRFRNRIIFPIRNISGSVIGFSGRIFGEGEPKYLNSPDNLLFNKSNNLFGLDKAKNSIKKENGAVLVEGNLDVIMSHQIGVTNVVCPLGTALTEKQLQLLRRFSDQLVVGFDQDDSGQKAALRSVDLAEKEGVGLKFARYSAKDPDELIRSNPNAWKKAVEEAVPVYDFLLDYLVSKNPLNEPSSLRKITKEFLPYFVKIENEMTRSHYERLLAKKLGISEDSVKAEMAKIPNKNTEDTKSVETKTSSEQLRLETYLMELIFQSGALPKPFESSELQFKPFRNLLQLAEKASKDNFFEAKSLKVPSELSEMFDKLTLAEIGENILNDQEILNKEIETCTLRLKELNLRTELKKVTLSIKQAEIAKNTEAIENFTKSFQDYSDRLAILVKQKELI